MPSDSNQEFKVKTDAVAIIPVNIFESVQSKSPQRTYRCNATQIAKAMRSYPIFTPRKEHAQLVTFNAYADGANRRGTASIELAHAICGDWDKNFGLQPFERGMAELAGAGAQVIAYQTYSHTPEAPRWRIFVFLDEPVLPTDYKTCWAGLNAIFDGNLDDNAKDCARLNYWPSCPLGQTRDFRTLNIEVA